MLFNSWEFLILLAATAVLYYLPIGGMGRRVWQVGLLLAASAVFYAWENPKLLALLGASCLLNAVATERILFWKAVAGRKTKEGTANYANGHELNEGELARRRGGAEETGREGKGANRARRWLWWTVGLNLGLLAFFKYAGFLSGLLPEGALPESLIAWLADIPLPVGISFYTFQGISLVADTWRRDIDPLTAERLSGRGRERLKSIRELSFYISFFPQLVAGPIVKAREFVPQIGAKDARDIDWRVVRRCLITGYFLKIFVADNLAEQTAALTIGAETVGGMSTVVALCLLYGYSFQIFADFGGYSLIAIGLGALFGYKLPPNFNFPYLATSITEFWRRWHLSLSSWLREYLYIPLGGNRKGNGRTYFNLFLVMFLGGLWHGAAWKFALWGSLHGLVLAFERLVSRRDAETQSGTADSTGLGITTKQDPSQKPSRSFQPSRLRAFARSLLLWFLTFHAVTFLWLTFMMPDMASIRAFFGALFSGRMGFSGPPVFSLVFYGSAVVLYHAWGWLGERRERLASKLARSPMEGVLHGVMVFLVLTNPGAPQGFIYFQF